MLARLYVNISQVYFPFYVTLTQDMDKSYVAILPMISYIASFLVSLIKTVPSINDKINKKVKMFFMFQSNIDQGLLSVGILIGIGTCVWMYFPLNVYSLYVVSVFIGICQAILLITSLSVTADLINKNTV